MRKQYFRDFRGFCVTIKENLDEVRYARSSERAAQEQSDEVGHYLQDDDPPGVVGFHTGLLRLVRIRHDVLNLLF